MSNQNYPRKIVENSWKMLQTEDVLYDDYKRSIQACKDDQCTLQTGFLSTKEETKDVYLDTIFANKNYVSDKPIIPSEFISPYSGVFKRLGMLLLWFQSTAVLVYFVMYLSRPYYQEQQPYTALQQFTLQAEKRYGLNNKEPLQLPIEKMHMFASATCVKGEFEQARRAMYMQLHDVPPLLRDLAIDSALVEGVSVQNSKQDATMSAESEGKGHAYLSFWSTQFIENPFGGEPQYSSCIMIAGLEMSVTEEIAGWEERTDYKTVGYQMCSCGWFSCDRCPIIKPVKEKRPLFKRHALTFEQQKQLHREMQSMAVQKANDLQHGGNNYWSLFSSGSFLPSSNRNEKEITYDSTWDFRDNPYLA